MVGHGTSYFLLFSSYHMLYKCEFIGMMGGIEELTLLHNSIGN